MPRPIQRLQKTRQSGFTLLEVIISLVILTVALTAIITVGSNRAETLLELREKNRALLVANNVLERYYSQPVETGTIDGKQENGQRNWNWQLEVTQSNNENIYRLDVRVSKYPNFDYAEARLTGFKWR